MNKVTAKSWLMALMFALIAHAAFAQGGATSSISGVVVDKDGGVVPGATIIATNDATAGKSTAISGGDGAFTIPALNIGKYTVTVALQGFKTAVLKDVTVTAGGPANVKAILEVGGLTETVVVEGATGIIQTNSSAVSTTLNTKQIASLPLSTRNTLDFITFLPGVQTPGGNRDSIINGLPQSTINITLDGVSVQDNYLKTTDGFFARLSPRLDAVEEVTVTTAGNGADASGQGATQIQFTTRSGSNNFTGSAYYYFQDDVLNTNTYFNKVRGLPKAEVRQTQPGIRMGGPVVIPGLYDGRGKAFFFFNYEEFRQPDTITVNSNFLTDEAQAGNFRYQTSSGVRTVNLYQLAAANGHVSTPDPTLAALLQDIHNATRSGGTITALDDNFTAQRFSFQERTQSHNRYPTVRIDYNLSTRHRLNMSYNFQDIVIRPDTGNDDNRTWPNFPIAGDQISNRHTFQTSLRSTLGASLVNEARVGKSGGPTIFTGGVVPEMWNGPLANQRGYALTLGNGLTNAGQSGPGMSSREGSTWFIDDKVSWLKGKHNFTFGGTFTQANVWLLNSTAVPTVQFGVVTGDTAAGMFSTTNFPNSSTAQRNAARDLYAMLVGRVSAINGTPRLDASTGQYVYNGESRQEGRLREFDLYIQDNWRVRPNLTVNAGVRYMIQRPFAALNNSYSTTTLDDAWGISGLAPGCDASDVSPANCNLFQAGNMPGSAPTYKNLAKGVEAYTTDWNNLAPSVGVNWTPSADDGWRRKLLGESGTTSLSAGYTRAYERHGMSDFTGRLDDNPGLTAQGNRNAANGNLGNVPLLFRNGNLGPPTTCSGTLAPPACIPEAPVYPIAATTTGTIGMFDPDLQIPYADTWTVGIQRALGKSSAFEIRYVGTRGRQLWLTYNYNEANILDNGFLNEFMLAQNNLYANLSAGRGETFAYFGPGTSTSPLPTYLAYFSGIPMAQAGNCSSVASCSQLYNSDNWTSSNFINPLNRFNPNPFTPAGTNANTGLGGSATRRNAAAAAGVARNFFYANPDALGGVNVTGNGGFSTYNGLQMQFRRRLSQGLQFDMNYAFGKAFEHTRYSFRVPFLTTRNSGTNPGDVTHAYKATFVYELPFGAGRRYANSYDGFMDRLVSDWTVSGTARLQSGRLLDLGNVRVIGMSQEDVQDAFHLRKVGPDEIYMWPQDIIDNTIKAYSLDLNGYTRGTPEDRYFAPANGPDCIEQIANQYGDCGVRTLVVTGPMFRTMDLTIAKDIKLAGTKMIQVRFDMLNVFDAVNFTPIVGQTNNAFNTTLGDYQITGANSGREIQLVLRFNW